MRFENPQTHKSQQVYIINKEKFPKEVRIFSRFCEEFHELFFGYNFFLPLFKFEDASIFMAYG